MSDWYLADAWYMAPLLCNEDVQLLCPLPCSACVCMHWHACTPAQHTCLLATRWIKRCASPRSVHLSFCQDLRTA